MLSKLLCTFARLIYNTVKPRLTDTPEKRTPMIEQTILKAPTVLPFRIVDTLLLCIMDSLRGPNCTQAILNDPDLADTRRPFQQDCPSSLL